MNINGLKVALEESLKLFETDKLAYFSLTCKNEFVIRDNLAFYLYLTFITYQ